MYLYVEKMTSCHAPVELSTLQSNVYVNARHSAFSAVFVFFYDTNIFDEQYNDIVPISYCSVAKCHQQKKSKFSESNSFMFDCQKKIFIMVIMMHKSGNGFISPICPKSTRK